jgi:hypothetical protein
LDAAKVHSGGLCCWSEKIISREDTRRALRANAKKIKVAHHEFSRDLHTQLISPLIRTTNRQLRVFLRRNSHRQLRTSLKRKPPDFFLSRQSAKPIPRGRKDAKVLQPCREPGPPLAGHAAKRRESDATGRSSGKTICLLRLIRRAPVISLILPPFAFLRVFASWRWIFLVVASAALRCVLVVMLF